MKKIIITGGSGFIGTNLVNFYLKKNYKVIDIDKISYCSIPYKYRNLSKCKKYKFIKSDIGNFSKIKNIFYRNTVDVIFNLASNSHVDRSIDNPKEFYASNVMSSLKFIDTILFLKRKKKFNGQIINISTDEVYGDIQGMPSKEDSKIETNSPYSASKASIENIFKAYSSTFKLNLKNIRCCNNYGPYQHAEKFIPTIILNCIQRKKIPIYGDGFQKREWIFVEDFCNAIDVIYKKGNLNEVFNVGSGYRMRNIAIAKIIIKILNRYDNKINNKLISYVKDRPGHDRTYKINGNKVRSLGWIADTNFLNGIKKTIDWFYKNKNILKLSNKKNKNERIGLG